MCCVGRSRPPRANVFYFPFFLLPVFSDPRHRCSCRIVRVNACIDHRTAPLPSIATLLSSLPHRRRLRQMSLLIGRCFSDARPNARGHDDPQLVPSPGRSRGGRGADDAGAGAADTLGEGVCREKPSRDERVARRDVPSCGVSVGECAIDRTARDSFRVNCCCIITCGIGRRFPRDNTFWPLFFECHYLSSPPRVSLYIINSSVCLFSTTASTLVDIGGGGGGVVFSLLIM